MESVSRRRAIQLGAAAVLATAAGGCASPQAPPAPGDLLWATGGTNVDSVAGAVAAWWNRQHPRGPQVRLVRLPTQAGPQRELAEIELGAGLPTFDIVDVDVIWTREFAEKGWLVDLSDLRDDLQRTIRPEALATATWDGSLWAAPLATDVGLLYYRSDLVGEPPGTWEELVEVGQRAARDHGIPAYVADGTQDEGLTVQFLEYLWGAGGDLFDPDGEVSLEPGPTRRALDFMRAATAGHFYAPAFSSDGQEDAHGTFASGGAVFLRSWPYAYRPMAFGPASAVGGRVGIAPIPVFAGGTTAPTTPALGGHNMAVSSRSRRAEVAVEFIRFASTAPEMQQILGLQFSFAPVLQQTYDEHPRDPMIAYLQRTLPSARLRPALRQWPAVTKEIQQRVFAAYTGAESTDDVYTALRGALTSVTESS